MEKVFNNILLPVKFEKQMEVAVKKGVAIANKLECNLHIVYTFPSPFFRREGFISPFRRLRIQEIRSKHAPELRSGLVMFTSYITGNRTQEIIRYSLAHRIDMIFLAQDHFKADELASETSSAVFISTMDHTPNSFERIILPIGCSLPITRIRVALFLAHQLQAAIHLVPLNDDSRLEEKLIYLKRAYQLLKENTDINLMCSMSPGDIKLERKSQVSLIIKEPAYSGKTPFVPGEGACRIECLA